MKNIILNYLINEAKSMKTIKDYIILRFVAEGISPEKAKALWGIIENSVKELVEYEKSKKKQIKKKNII